MPLLPSHKRQHRLFSFVIILGLMAAPMVRAEEPPSLAAIFLEMRLTLNDLFFDIKELKSPDKALAESPGVVRDYAGRLDAYLQKTGNSQEVIENKKGRSLLAQAVFFGYADVVEVFLKHPAVREEARNHKSFLIPADLWSIASIAPIQSAFLCRSQAGMLAPFSVIYLVQNPDRTPYVRVRQLLEEAGVPPNPAGARDLWHKFCAPTGPTAPKLRLPGLHERVLAAPDLLLAIEAELAVMHRLMNEGRHPSYPAMLR